MAKINGSLTANIAFQQVSTTLPGSPSLLVPQSLSLILNGNGTAADQCDLKHTRKYTLAASPLTLDLTNLLDVEGNAVNFARVRGFIAKIEDQTDGHDVLFGFASTTANAWTAMLSNPGQLTIKPSSGLNNGGLIWTAPNTTGWPVGPTSKLIQFDPGGNTIVLDLEIVGASV